LYALANVKPTKRQGVLCMTQMTATGFVVSDVSARVGEKAPQFSLPSARALDELEQPIALSDFRTRWLILLFYPFDFSRIGASELLAFGERAAELRERDADLLGISTDSTYAHRVWLSLSREQGGLGPLPFPLASDATHAVSRAYGVLVSDKGHARPGTFIIDPNGVLRYAAVHDLAVGRSCTETLRTLHGLASGGVCPADWQPGQPTL
jgi:peroxiredoxin 2/4